MKKKDGSMTPVEELRQLASDAVYDLFYGANNTQGERSQQQAAVVQLTQRVRVETPPSCGSNSSIRTSDEAEIEFTEAWKNLQTISEGEIANRIASAAEKVARTRGRDFMVKAETKAKINVHLQNALEGLVQQEAQVNQIIHRVRANICHIVMGNEFAITIAAESSVAEGVNIIAKSQEWLDIFPTEKDPRTQRDASSHVQAIQKHDTWDTLVIIAGVAVAILIVALMAKVMVS